MKRNTDTIRDILSRLEALPAASYLSLRHFEPQDKEAAYVISYHMELLIKDGLVDGTVSRELTEEPAHFIARRLTSEGHNYLNELRNDTGWRRIKVGIFKRVGKGMSALILAAFGAAVATATQHWLQ